MTGWEEERNEQERGVGGRGEEGREIEHKQMQQLRTKKSVGIFRGEGLFLEITVLS